ncbi:MAG TPA: glycosyltransferase family 1 protein [Clostridiales bacterium]|nr:glycosyltransferase family 1 protein [Clostridiales bacterium]
MKKIAINMLPFTNRLPGTGNYIKRLLFFLQKLDTQNNYYLYFGNCDDPKGLFGICADNFSIIKCGKFESKLKRIFYEQFIFPSRIAKLKPDYLFCPSVAVPVFLFSGTKIITTIHDLIPFVFKEKYSFVQRSYINLISYLSAKKADKILTVSENSKKDIIKFLHIKEEKIKVLYNFLSSDMPEKKNQPRENFFITVSTINPGKNLEKLFEAFNVFHDINSNFKLYVIGGKGWNYESIFLKVKELNMEKAIIFLGYLKDDELYKYYQKAKALVYVSTYEGFGIPPLEALHFNCPVVVSNISSLPEVVGEAGFLVDPYNVNSIAEGMTQCTDESKIAEKLKYFPDQLNKFDGETETKKFLSLIR